MPHLITGTIQHYAWGGYQFIPQLLGQPNPDREPCAEYWLGAHQKGPSLLWYDPEQSVSLDSYIARDPQGTLGAKTADTFGRLPYLLKILDVRDMLSIQVHPTKEEAEAGFARENAAGIPLDAPERNYKDDNHKPEMMVALSEFYLLHGFRPEPALRQVLNEVPELRVLSGYFDKRGYDGLYSHVMNMPQLRVGEILTPLLRRVAPLYQQGVLSRDNPDFWAARAVERGMSPMDRPDRGIFSLYLFNLVKMAPGEGIFQAAGIPHAYLEGQNVELMANSDNVLRGGLTPKHVDVDELLAHTRFEGVIPAILPDGGGDGRWWQYPLAVPDFTLSKISINKNDNVDIQTGTISIFLVMSGRVSITGNPSLTAGRGEALLMTAGEKATWQAQEDTLVYRASVPGT
jgi:mannose-6-phosphate isomerase